MAHDSEYKKESNYFDFVYTIRFHKNASDPNYDQLTYTILITNTTAEKISNLKVNFNFHDNMTKYLTEPRFLTAPIELEKENSDPTDKRNSFEFIKSVSVVKPESLDVSEQELLKSYYHYLYIDFIWDHGEEHILLDKSQLDDVPL